MEEAWLRARAGRVGAWRAEVPGWAESSVGRGLRESSPPKGAEVLCARLRPQKREHPRALLRNREWRARAPNRSARRLLRTPAPRGRTILRVAFSCRSQAAPTTAP